MAHPYEILPDDQLEGIVASDHLAPSERGTARAVLERRRRQWEEEQATVRRDFEMEQFNAEGVRDARRKQFEEALANKQMAHATALADKQETTAKRVAAATVYAAIAAGLSALGAVIDASLEIAKFFSGH
jgi:hypothetical protein